MRTILSHNFNELYSHQSLVVFVKAVAKNLSVSGSKAPPDILFSIKVRSLLLDLINAFLHVNSLIRLKMNRRVGAQEFLFADN